MTRRLATALLLAAAAAAFGAGQRQAPLPSHADSLKFAVIGDAGTGERPQYEIAAQMDAARAEFPFELVIMVGDNLYGRQAPADFVAKFTRPYTSLLRAGVLFYAALGNHDDQSNRMQRDFNMNGERYYTYVKKNVRFLVLDTNQLDPQQLAWIDRTMSASTEPWVVCYFHHPLYSSARRHGSNIELRVALEPLLVKHHVDVVFAGHDHVYERSTPQKGITHFVAGSSGQLRRGDIRPGSSTAAYFDQDQAFMLVEVAGDEMFFAARSRTGRIVDTGVIRRQSRNGRGES